MKIKVLFPIVCLALLIATPQAEAQSKRSERKLKKEMRKLEKQMKKVQELKHVSYFPLTEEIELIKVKELEKMHEYQDQARKYQVKARVHQREAQEHLRRAFEDQKHEYIRLREVYPEGIHIDEIEIPEMNFVLPEFDMEFPEMEFEFEGKPAKVYRSMATLTESDNNLSIKTNLDDESIDKSYNFTVADDASYLNLRANGSVSAGNIEIEIKNPQDKEFQTIELTPAADVDWSQKVKLNDEKKKNLKGKWTIRIKGDDVKGKFGISLRSK